MATRELVAPSWLPGIAAPDRQEPGQDVTSPHRGGGLDQARDRKVGRGGLVVEPQAVGACGDDERWSGAHGATQRAQLLARVAGLGKQVLAACHEEVEAAQGVDRRARQGSQGQWPHLRALVEAAQPALEDRGTDRHRPQQCELVGEDLSGHGRHQDRPRAGDEGRSRDRHPAATTLEPQPSTFGGVAVDEGGGRIGVRRLERDSQLAKLSQARLGFGLGSGSREDGNPHPARSGGPGDMQHRPARRGGAIGESVDRQATDDEEVGAGGYHRAIMKLFFYELHEGATDLLTDAVLVSDRQYTPEAFAALVHAARAAVVDTFEEDTLVEAIARELERSHGFTYAGDEKLTASMSVGMDEADTYLVETSDEFRSVIAEVDLSS